MSWHFHLNLVFSLPRVDVEAVSDHLFSDLLDDLSLRSWRTQMGICGYEQSVPYWTVAQPCSYHLQVTAELSRSHYSTEMSAAEATLQLATKLLSYFARYCVTASLHHLQLVSLPNGYLMEHRVTRTQK